MGAAISTGATAGLVRLPLRHHQGKDTGESASELQERKHSPAPSINHLSECHEDTMSSPRGCVCLALASPGLSDTRPVSAGSLVRTVEWQYRAKVFLNIHSLMRRLYFSTVIEK